MRSQAVITALALLSSVPLTVAQDCPAGYAKSDKVAWVDCPTEDNSALQCATLEVPMDWTIHTFSEKLKLRLVRQPATSGTKIAKSIIMNPGGPGDSGIKMIVDGGVGWQKIVGENFHMIGFDPRGVGLSIPFTCPEATGNPGPLNTDAGLEATLKFNQDQARICSAPIYRPDLVGTAFVARDVRAIAEALGEDGLIRFWGFSYGTLLGSTVAAMFPNIIDRVILDGNINPTDYYRGLGAEALASVDSAARNLFNQCAEAGPQFCAVAVAGQDGKQLQDTFDSFLAKRNYAQSKQLRDALFTTLSYSSLTAFVDFAKSLAGYYKDPTTLGKRSLATRQLDWKPDYTPVRTDFAIAAIACGDVIQRFQGSRENYKRWLAEYEAVSKYGGESAITLLYLCSVWTVDAKEKFTGAFSGIKTKHPILYVNTQYDPVTPLASAQNSSAGFIGSRVLQSSGVGHTTIPNDSPELTLAVKAYMNHGVFPSENKVYAPKVANVFKRNANRTSERPTLNNRHVRYPAFFDNDAAVKRADDIPAGCTKIAASSTPAVSASTSARTSASPSASLSSRSISPRVSTGSTPSHSASLSGPVPSASSVAMTKIMSTTVSASSLLSAMLSQPSSNALLFVSYGEVPSGSVSVTRHSKDSHIYSASPASQQSAPTSVSYVARSYDSYSASGANGYGTQLASKTASQGYGQYDDFNQAISSSRATQAWASQSGCVQVTKTYTTTTVQTITACRRDDKSCPLNSALLTAVVTETKTIVAVVAVPTTTVYVTRIVDVCSTGLTTSTATISQTCNAGCTVRPAGVPQGYTTTVKYCDACATPSKVTVTYCTACADKPTSALILKSFPPSIPTLVSATPVKISSSVKVSSIPGYGPPPHSAASTSSASAPVSLPTSKVVNETPSQPAKPSIPVLSAATTVKGTPAASTGFAPANSTTLGMSAASSGAYGCSTGNCVATPTASKPVEFTDSNVFHHRPSQPTELVTFFLHQKRLFLGTTISTTT
ncbi:alpha/beta-hydrolase [Ophiobolus disseminans]|uniref:Alpha/beta-hydrolase n=1 Tax=Ophiobolus disseminans TaxID=1469910 RepID=A0A6A7A6J7_9PLEO|nr:alpha/beta-hydrolase [Ophiobolus disseminans]